MRIERQQTRRGWINPLRTEDRQCQVAGAAARNMNRCFAIPEEFIDAARCRISIIEKPERLIGDGTERKQVRGIIGQWHTTLTKGGLNLTFDQEPNILLCAMCGNQLQVNTMLLEIVAVHLPDYIRCGVRLASGYLEGRRRQWPDDIDQQNNEQQARQYVQPVTLQE